MAVWMVQVSKQSYAEDAAEHAQAIARLQGQVAAAKEKANRAEEESARLRAEICQLQQDNNAKTAGLETQVVRHAQSQNFYSTYMG